MSQQHSTHITIKQNREKIKQQFNQTKAKPLNINAIKTQLSKKFNCIAKYKTILNKNKFDRKNIPAIFFFNDIYLRSKTEKFKVDVSNYFLTNTILGKAHVPLTFWTSILLLNTDELTFIKNQALLKQNITIIPRTLDRVSREGPVLFQWILSLLLDFCAGNFRYFLYFPFFKQYSGKLHPYKYYTIATFLKKYLRLQKLYRYFKYLEETPDYFLSYPQIPLAILMYKPFGWELLFPFKNLHLGQLISYFKHIRKI